jgi:Zinc dependent phospholipase C
MKHTKGSNHFSGMRRCEGLLRFPRTRLVLCVMAAVLAVSGLTTTAQACGVIAHHHIAEQAVTRLDHPDYSELASILNSYPGQLTYGAVFPDWGSAWAWWDVKVMNKDPNSPEVIEHNNMSEDAHWPEFEAAYLQALLPTLGNPYSVDDKKAIAFTFGLIAHNEADYAFHWRFLIAALQHGDAGTFGDHIPVEAGSDTIVRDAYEGGLFGNYCVGWDLPEKVKPAIAQAYSALGYTLSATDLIDGYNIQGTQCKDESLWAARTDIPWTTANLATYPDGGLDDMYRIVTAAWQHEWDQMKAHSSVSSIQP